MRWAIILMTILNVCSNQTVATLNDRVWLTASAFDAVSNLSNANMIGIKATVLNISPHEYQPESCQNSGWLLLKIIASLTGRFDLICHSDVRGVLGPAILNTIFQESILYSIAVFTTKLSFQMAMIVANLIGSVVSYLATFSFFMIMRPYLYRSWSFFEINIAITLVISSFIILACPWICSIATWKLVLLAKVLPMFAISMIDILIDINYGRGNVKYFIYKFISESIMTMIFGILWTFEMWTALYVFIILCVNILYFWFHQELMPRYRG